MDIAMIRPKWEVLYSYYNNKDINKYLISSLCSMLSMFFLQFIVIVITLSVNWKLLLTCELYDDNPCTILSHYLSSPFYLSFGSVFIWMNIVVVTFYSMFLGLSYFNGYWSLRRVNQYILSIGLSQYHIKTMKWDDLVKHIANRESNDALRLIDESRTEILKTKLLLKKMIRSGLIGRIGYTNITEWIFNGMFSDAFYIGSGNEITKRSIILGIISIIVVMFSFISIIIYYIVKHSESVHHKKDYIGPRIWTKYATLFFSKNNELKHEVEYRLTCSSKHVGLYLEEFPTPWLSVVARFITFVSSSFLTIMFIALFNENIMLYVTLFDRNLLFYTGIFTTIFTISKITNADYSSSDYALDNDEDTSPDAGLPYNPKRRMNSVMKYIQPPSDIEVNNWKAHCDTYPVRNLIISLYPVRSYLFLLEILTILALPYIFLVHIPKNASKFYNVIRNTTQSDRRLGWTTNNQSIV